MFEFHGWVNIKVDDSDDADINTLDARLNELSDQIEEEVNNTEWSNCVIRLFRGLNADEQNGLPWQLAMDWVRYAELCRQKGEHFLAGESLGKAIAHFKECSADGWI